MTLDTTPIPDTIPAPAIPAAAAPAPAPVTIPATTTPASQLTAVLGILGPLIVQVIAIIGAVVIVLVHDGSTEQTVINALLAIVIPNSLAAGATAVMHMWAGTKGGTQ